MGKFNYLLMLLRVRIMFFIRDEIIGRFFYRRLTSRSMSTLKKTGDGEQQTQRSAEYRIYIQEEHITHFLN